MDIKYMKRGDWMPGDVKPESPGVYERESEDGRFFRTTYSAWDGFIWKWACLTPEKAAQAIMDSINQDAPWRGQLEYDPHNAPDGFVAELAEGRGCGDCDLEPAGVLCHSIPCITTGRPDGRSVIMKRAKP
jgi:hypothetical protein